MKNFIYVNLFILKPEHTTSIKNNGASYTTEVKITTIVPEGENAPPRMISQGNRCKQNWNWRGLAQLTGCESDERVIKKTMQGLPEVWWIRKTSYRQRVIEANQTKLQVEV